MCHALVTKEQRGVTEPHPSIWNITVLVEPVVKYSIWQWDDKDIGSIETSEIRTLNFLRWMQACMAGRSKKYWNT
jgi:hypothetical protein